MKHVAIVTKRFSPNSEVGARRWSKLVQYLQEKKDIRLTVIAQKEYCIQNQNPWNITLDKTNVEVIEVADLLNNISTSFPALKGLITRFEIHFNNYLGYTDEGHRFSKKAKQVLEKINPDVIIASAPAYTVCYFMSLLKLERPKIKLIHDFRDAWMEGFFAWNKHLTPKSSMYLKQLEMEKFTINTCDILVSVTPEIVEQFQKKMTTPSVKTAFIPNGYDPRDKRATQSVPKKLANDKINICHFGTLDFGREDEFYTFYTSIKSDNLNFFLIGNSHSSLIRKMERFKNVHFIARLEEDELHAYFQHADYHLMVNDREFYFAYGSKVFDAMLYNKPILFISKNNSLIEKYKGSVRFIHSNNSGDSNRTLVQQLKKPNTASDVTTDYSAFELKTLAERYYQLIMAN
jgi:glycosyltransferase involved in cell wall biosynthesis